MTSPNAAGVGASSGAGRRLNPAELKIELLCRGALIDSSCRIEEVGRPVRNRRHDRENGLELILPGEMRDLWVNVPVLEKYVANSPYLLIGDKAEYFIADQIRGYTYPVSPAPKPDWYGRSTRRGMPMMQVGFMHGTILQFDIGEQCRIWEGPPGSATAEEKAVEDVVETALTARNSSGITFALLRGGYLGPGSLIRLFPYIEALKQEVGILVGVQFPAEAELRLYDQARALGVDHFSFPIDLFNQAYAARFGTDSCRAQRQELTLRALEYCARSMGKGRASAEIVAGVEPIESTIEAIGYFVRTGALPLVFILRPVEGTRLQNLEPPCPDDMLPVFRHLYETCRSHNLPIGLLPNIHLSSILHPVDTVYLARDASDGRAYQRWIVNMGRVMYPYFQRRMRRRGSPQADPSA